MEVLSIARTGGQRRTGVCRHPDHFAAFATLPTSGNRASGHRPGTSGQCSSRERATPFSTTPASSASLKPPPTSVCRCPSTRSRRPEGSSMSAYRGFDEVTGLLLSTGGMGMALLGRPGDSAPDPRRDAGLGRDARPLRRPCRSAQHRCPAPAARLPGLHHRQPGRHPRTLSAAVDVLGPADSPAAPSQQATAKSSRVSAVSTSAARSAGRAAPAPSSTMPRSTSGAGTSSATSTPNVPRPATS